MEEFEKYLKDYKADATNNARETIMAKTQELFLSINGRPPIIKTLERSPKKPRVDATRTDSKSCRPVSTRPTRGKQVFVFDIEDSFVYLDCFLDKNKAPTNIYRIAKELDDIIIEIACDLFFYRDLKNFDQPHIEYYKAFDDGIDLR